MVLKKDFLGLYLDDRLSLWEDKVLGVLVLCFQNSNLRICGRI